MKLIYRIALRLSLVLLPLMALWAALFYYTMVGEINDEADDALEDYSTLIISRMLAGRELPSLNSGSNNSYSITPVDAAYADTHPHIDYYDADIFIPEKDETEPARVLVTIFTDRDGEVILKKYSPIGEMSSFAKDYTESLFRSLGHIAVIVDRDQVVAASGLPRKELGDKPISRALETAIASRQTVALNQQSGGRMVAVTTEEDQNPNYTAQVISPIIADGEAIGAVLLMSRDNGVKMGDTELKVAETAAGIVGRQMEQ